MSPRKKKTVAPKRHPWGFAEGKYLSTSSISRNSIWSGAHVNALRAALGLGAGIYYAEVRQRVIAAQEAAGAPVTGVVAEGDWNMIVNGEQPQADESETPEV